MSLGFKEGSKLLGTVQGESSSDGGSCTVSLVSIYMASRCFVLCKP